MATKYIAHYEVYRNCRTHVFRWEDKEFSTYEDAEYYCAKMRKKYQLGAVVKVIEDKPKYDHDLALAERTVDRYVDRMFASGRIF